MSDSDDFTAELATPAIKHGCNKIQKMTTPERLHKINIFAKN